MEIKELICIGCPLGCNLKAVYNGNEIAEVTGNTCKRGDLYARQELTDPRRTLTTVVKVKNGQFPVVSVRTSEDIPKNKLKECVKILKDIEITAPVHIGDVILKNVVGTTASVIATKSIATKYVGE